MELKEIDNLAELCRIEIPEKEKKELLGEMSAVLDFVKQIQEVETVEKKPTAGELRNVLREDKNPRAGGIYTKDILAEAPKTEKGYIKVKKIL
ncbi:MAG: Asp-tRNA(Asn)/Glu-tRNA(Gln) amidotransferase subunit GatC [Candidatus Pacebacteria bacterium]|nr:Asp-tRNA(Asn)/Glu-tRNA(Gln) amidotransferase subunit GatC [Candidatus Paceibacterota bacterium]